MDPRAATSATFVLLALLALWSQQCHAAEWEELIPKVVHKLSKSLTKAGEEEEEVELLGGRCLLTRHHQPQPTLFRYTFTCPDHIDVLAKAFSRSKYGLTRKVIQNFFEKAYIAGLVNKDDTEAWVNE